MSSDFLRMKEGVRGKTEKANTEVKYIPAMEKG